MIDTNDLDIPAYVAASLPAVGLRLDPARLAAVTAAFALVVRVGAPALTCEVSPAIEPAPVFVP
jgi:hypothetical protein